MSAAGGSVSIVEADSTQLNSVTAGSFDLESGGNVNDVIGAVFDVTGLTTIDTQGDISLGADPTTTINLGSIDLIGDRIFIDNDGTSTINIDDLTADTLDFTTQGSIAASTGAGISVTDLASITAIGDVQLTAGTVNFGSINLSANSASLTESSSTTFAELNVTSDFFLNSLERIDALQNADLAVGGLFSMNAGDDGVVDLSGTFGRLDVTAGVVNLTLDAPSTSVENVTASSLAINSLTNSLEIIDFGLDVSGAVFLTRAISHWLAAVTQLAR